MNDRLKQKIAGLTPVIRPALPSDKEAVLQFTSRTWESGDYISMVWDNWLAEVSGRLLVMTLKGKPVSVIHVVLAAPGEAWIEGLRVDPLYRRAGLAYLMVQRTIEEAKALGASVIRFLTASTNTPIHLISAKLGFDKVVDFQHYQAEVKCGTPSSTTASPKDLPSLSNFIRETQEFKSWHGLTARSWRFFSFNESQMNRLVDSNKMRISRNSNGIKTAVTIDTGFRHDLMVSYAGSSKANLPELLLDLSAVAASMNLDQVLLRIPANSPWELLLPENGYKLTEDSSYWIFEQKLQVNRYPDQSQNQILMKP